MFDAPEEDPAPCGFCEEAKPPARCPDDPAAEDTDVQDIINQDTDGHSDSANA
jgi:hypothetical protein